MVKQWHKSIIHGFKKKKKLKSGMPTMEENTQILKKNIGKKVALEKPVGWKKKKK